jgi:hypothetical protein
MHSVCDPELPDAGIVSQTKLIWQYPLLIQDKFSAENFSAGAEALDFLASSSYSNF